MQVEKKHRILELKDVASKLLFVLFLCIWGELVEWKTASFYRRSVHFAKIGGAHDGFSRGFCCLTLILLLFLVHLLFIYSFFFLSIIRGPSRFLFVSCSLHYFYCIVNSYLVSRGPLM